MVCINVDKKIYSRIFKWHSPEQRLFLGVTALPTLSLYDYFGSPDEKTKKVALSKTWAKVIAGTLTGYLIRKGGIELIRHFSQADCVPIKNSVKSLVKDNENKKLSSLYPRSWLGEREITYDEFELERDKYVKYFGTCLAIGAMLITNFVIDAPLTVFLTNYFRENVFKIEKSQIDTSPIDTKFLRNAIQNFKKGAGLSFQGGAN